jgi:outer membrane protein TolC
MNSNARSLVVLLVLLLARDALAQTNVAPRYTLVECVNLALAKNPDVLIARKRVEEAAGMIVEARAGYLPALLSWGNYQKLESSYATLSGAIPTRRDEIWTVAVRLTQNIYSGGAVPGRMQIARLTRDSRLLEYEAAVDRMIMDTRIAFYDILQNQAQVAVRQQAVALLKGELQNQRHRLELGTGDRMQALRAEVTLSLEQASLLDATNRLSNAFMRLGELLAIPQPPAANIAPFAVTGELAYVRHTLDVGACLARALELRPEMKARGIDITVQKQQYIVDRSALLPRVDLFIGYDVVSDPNPYIADKYHSGGIGGISVNWMLFDGFAAKGRMNATRQRLRQAEVSRDATSNAIQAEVMRAFHDLEQAEETIQTQQKNVGLARESLQLSQTNMALGLATQLDLLQAQLDYTRAQTTELVARFSYNAALARLQRAISSRFTILEDTPRPPTERRP